MDFLHRFNPFLDASLSKKINQVESPNATGLWNPLNRPIDSHTESGILSLLQTIYLFKEARLIVKTAYQQRTLRIVFALLFSLVVAASAQAQDKSDKKVDDEAQREILDEGYKKYSLVLDRLGWRMLADGRDAMAEYYLQIKEGLGTEARRVAHDAPADKPGASVDRIADFLYRRSGLRLSAEIKTRLAALEDRALDGASARLSLPELAEAASQTLLERIGKLTDAEIARAAQSFRTANWEGREAAVSLRVNQIHGDGMTPEEFIRHARLLRDSTSGGGNWVSELSREGILHELEWRLGVFKKAVPEQWARAASEGVTPIQAFLLVYSAASSDLLVGQRSLRLAMQAVERELKRREESAPDSEGRFAYGANGYLYSTPLDLILSETNLARLLDRFDARSSK